MRLRTLTLRDFGTIRGEQTLELAPREKRGQTRPIVLIGGQNGAGKTTILDAIRLCLYGRLALGNRVADTEYRKFLRDRIHRDKHALIHSDVALVRLSFDHSHAGRRTVYTVERSWQAQGKVSVAEEVLLLRDGQPLTDVESQHWESFVRGLVPYGLSQLFFFDGERIQRLAEDGVDSDSLGESVKAMLGLDLVEQLQADLSLFELKHLSKSTTKKKTRVRLEELGTALETLRERDAQLCQESGGLTAMLDALAGEAARIEEKLSLRGKGLADERKRLSHDATELQARVEAHERTLRELLEGALPLALCAKLCRATLAQLESETKQERAAATKDELASALNIVRQDLLKPAFIRQLGLDEASKRALAGQLVRTRERLMQAVAASVSAPPVHGLSEYDARRCREQANEGMRSGVPKAQKITKELTALESKLREVKTHLNRAPEHDDLAALVREVEEVGERRGGLVAQREQVDKERHLVLTELERHQGELNKLLEEADAGRTPEGKLDLSTRVKAVLEVYLERLSKEKIGELQRHARDAFARLCRKSDFVREMRIDPLTFRVTLLDAHGRELQKAELSAGEKQIYAISILWALAKVAARPLPMIIDTPLGRLDSQHRRRLVEEYFPHASHQVIILSTDTEIDSEHLAALRPHISHTIHLVHNEEEGWTEAIAGYFWGAEHAGAASV